MNTGEYRNYLYLMLKCCLLIDINWTTLILLQLHAGVILKNESITKEMLEILQYCHKYPTENHQHQVLRYIGCKLSMLTQNWNNVDIYYAVL